MHFDFENISNDHLIIVVVGYVIVFLSLFLLWGVFYNLPRILKLNPSQLKSLFTRKAPEKSAPEPEVRNGELTGEEAAAISAAIYLFVGQLHDEENTVLTIHKISRRYSPWSSKIYNVINGLNKRF